MERNYILFGSFNTATNGLILTNETIGRPESKARVDQLELYGLPDFDDYDITRSRRTLTFEFVLFDGSQWPAVYGNLSKALEGVKLKITRALEPNYFYLGRCKVNPFKTSRGRGIITVDVDAEPFKYSVNYNTVTMTNNLQKTITPVTDYLAPAVITITPTNALTDLTLTGFARDKVKRIDEQIVLKAMSVDVPVMIDGEQHKVTVGGQNAYADIITQMWEWPSVLPQKKTVMISDRRCTVEIKYRGRFI